MMTDTEAGPGSGLEALGHSADVFGAHSTSPSTGANPSSTRAAVGSTGEEVRLGNEDGDLTHRSYVPWSTVGLVSHIRGCQSIH